MVMVAIHYQILSSLQSIAIHHGVPPRLSGVNRRTRKSSGAAASARPWSDASGILTANKTQSGSQERVYVVAPRHNWHLTRQAYYRALDQLETAGLIVVERRPGRPIRVTLRD